MEKILLEHFRRYPAMQIADMVKLLYQSEFGGGHMVQSEEDSLRRLRAECESCPEGDKVRFESIGGRLCRMYLARELPLSAEKLNRAFVQAASRQKGSVEAFEKKLDILGGLCRSEELPFSLQELEEYCGKYRAMGFPPVSHSEIYRRCYRPAYRVVSCDIQRFFPALCAVDALVRSKERAVVAIDGCSGSGKSYLGSVIEKLFPCNLFHMDDYFLQPGQRTPERLAEPGGNLDYERFEAEIIQKMGLNKKIVFRKFDCSTQTLQSPRETEPAPLTVLEGVYSCHPRWREKLDLKIFLTVRPEIQRKRILLRSGPQMLERFEQQWIPLEDRYFKYCALPGESDLALDTQWEEE